MYSTGYTCLILIMREFSRNVFEKKYSNIKFHGSQVVPRGQTDRRTEGRKHRHNEANSRFSQFSELAYKANIVRKMNWNDLPFETSPLYEYKQYTVKHISVIVLR